MRLHNIFLVIKDQLPFSRLIKNIRKGHILGLISRRSHKRKDGTPKITYNTKVSATKAAENMKERYGKHFSNYKCLWCNGYHLGKNRENK